MSLAGERRRFGRLTPPPGKRLTRAQRRYIEMRLHEARPFALVENPKTGERLVALRRNIGGGMYEVQIRPYTRGRTDPRTLLGLAELICDFHREWLQIHTQVDAPGSGHGAAVYLASAVLAKLRGFRGIESPVPPWKHGHDRTEAASRWWDKAVALGVATRRNGWDRITGDAALATGFARVPRRSR